MKRASIFSFARPARKCSGESTSSRYCRFSGFLTETRFMFQLRAARMQNVRASTKSAFCVACVVPSSFRYQLRTARAQNVRAPTKASCHKCASPHVPYANRGLYSRSRATSPDRKHAKKIARFANTHTKFLRRPYATTQNFCVAGPVCKMFGLPAHGPFPAGRSSTHRAQNFFRPASDGTATQVAVATAARTTGHYQSPYQTQSSPDRTHIKLYQIHIKLST